MPYLFSLLPHLPLGHKEERSSFTLRLIHWRYATHLTTVILLLIFKALNWFKCCSLIQFHRFKKKLRKYGDSKKAYFTWILWSVLGHWPVGKLFLDLQPVHLVSLKALIKLENWSHIHKKTLVSVVFKRVNTKISVSTSPYAVSWPTHKNSNMN